MFTNNQRQQRLGTTSAKRRRLRKHRADVRLSVEQMEQRLVLSSTIVGVTGSTIDGPVGVTTPNKWMSELSAGVPLTDISLPGTYMSASGPNLHDAFFGNGADTTAISALNATSITAAATSFGLEQVFEPEVAADALADAAAPTDTGAAATADGAAAVADLAAAALAGAFQGSDAAAAVADFAAAAASTTGSIADAAAALGNSLAAATAYGLAAAFTAEATANYTGAAAYSAYLAANGPSSRNTGNNPNNTAMQDLMISLASTALTADTAAALADTTAAAAVTAAAVADSAAAAADGTAAAADGTAAAEDGTAGAADTAAPIADSLNRSTQRGK